MKVVVAATNEDGCAYYRIEQPVVAAMKADPSLEVENLKHGHFESDPPSSLYGIGENTKVVKLNDAILDVDLVIIQRPLFNFYLELIRELQKAGIKVIVELDDHLAAVPKTNVASKAYKPQYGTTLKRCCKEADHVTTTTELLAASYGYGHATILPNYVPHLYTEISRGPSSFPQYEGIVGWAGFLGTHPDVVARGVGSAVEANRWGFCVLGSPDGIADKFGLTKPFIHVPPVSVEKYPHEVAKFDIGLAPLGNSVFSRSKSGLKILEMASLGVPCIGSDVAPYRDQGLGILVKQDEWASQIHRLIRHPELRTEIADQNRQMVRDFFTYEKNAQQWLDCWSKIIRG